MLEVKQKSKKSKGGSKSKSNTSSSKGSKSPSKQSSKLGPEHILDLSKVIEAQQIAN